MTAARADACVLLVDLCVVDVDTHELAKQLELSNPRARLNLHLASLSYFEPMLSGEMGDDTLSRVHVPCRRAELTLLLRLLDDDPVRRNDALRELVENEQQQPCSFPTVEDVLRTADKLGYEGCLRRLRRTMVADHALWLRDLHRRWPEMAAAMRRDAEDGAAALRDVEAVPFEPHDAAAVPDRGDERWLFYTRDAAPLPSPASSLPPAPESRRNASEVHDAVESLGRQREEEQEADPSPSRRQALRVPNREAQGPQVQARTVDRGNCDGSRHEDGPGDRRRRSAAEAATTDARRR